LAALLNMVRRHILLRKVAIRGKQYTDPANAGFIFLPLCQAINDIAASQKGVSMSASDDQLSVFPAFFRVEGKDVAVIGNGEEALAKVRLLLNTRARITLVADQPGAQLMALAIQHDIRHLARAFDAAMLDGVVLVFAATGDAAEDRRIAAAARALKIPVNAVDQPDQCDFLTPAIVNRAPVAVAIGTEGAGPVLAQMIRAQIDQLLSPSLGRLARLATLYRDAVDHVLPKGVTRRIFWRRFFSGAVADAVSLGRMPEAKRAASGLLESMDAVPGHVWLVGAGPGAEDLLTLRAQRVMMEADAIVYDALVPQAIVDMGRRDAERIPVGKRKGCHSKSQDEINDLLVELGAAGKRVVRLKSGDPLVYGRAAEEMGALRDAGISYEIVPGITSAFAAAADFELPLTLRGVASSLIFTTGHDLAGDVLPDWASLAISGATIAVYMGRSVAASVAERLISAGLPSETTVAVIENASRRDRRMLHGVLADLPGLDARDDLTGPVMVIIGEAVAGANLDNSEPLLSRERQTADFTGA
jgi:uroporphyrin-III C-methyltransferase/precorrin-2 dehydrogenase/sirohydrochlorin ferrochelatase